MVTDDVTYLFIRGKSSYSLQSGNENYAMPPHSTMRIMLCPHTQLWELCYAPTLNYENYAMPPHSTMRIMLCQKQNPKNSFINPQFYEYQTTKYIILIPRLLNNFKISACGCPRLGETLPAHPWRFHRISRLSEPNYFWVPIGSRKLRVTVWTCSG